MADSYVFEESNITQSTVEPFVRRELTYVTDTNNGSYNGQIRFESSQTANSGKWSNYSEGFLLIPLTVAVKSTVDITGYDGPNGFMVGLKNGYHQLINSVQVILESTTVVQQTPYTNFYVSYKLNTSFSGSDIAKYGSSLNFYLDSASAFQYNTGASVYGNGLANNVVYPVTAVSLATKGFKGETFNAGFLRRLQNCGYDGSTTTANFGGCYAIYTAPATTLKNNFTNDAGAAAARVYYWNITAKIRLKDICDFFAQCPLLKGGFFKIYINTNTSSFLLTTTSAAGNMSIAATTDLTITGATNPLMVASSATSNPMQVVCGTADKNFYIACGITKATVNNSTVSHTLSSCRLYVPLYTMSSTYETEYLSLHPTQTIVYNDIQQYTVSNISATSGTFNQLLTNGITNAQQLVVIPIINGSSAGNNATVPFYPYESPFTTEPATTSPLAALKNFNVSISGINVWQEAETYEFDTFLNEVAPANAINGGQSTGITSGLIDQAAWSNAYRYYVVNLSRRNSADDHIPKSILISGGNACAKPLDLYTFIVFQRSLTVDTETGKPIV